MTSEQLKAYHDISYRAELRDRLILEKKLDEKFEKQEAWDEYNKNLGEEQFFGGQDDISTEGR